jgi:hypothetical protein
MRQKAANEHVNFERPLLAEFVRIRRVVLARIARPELTQIESFRRAAAL